MRHLNKKIICFSVVLVMLLSFAVVNVSAAEWNNKYYRFNDFVGIVTEEQEALIEAKASGSIEKYKFDFPIAVVKDTDGETLQDYSDWFYEHNEFGYGENKDGILFVYDKSSGYFRISQYGRGQEIFTSETISTLLKKTNEAWSSDGFTGAVTRYLDLCFEVLDGTDITASKEESKENETASWNGYGINPNWRETNASTFKDFHGKDLPRVVDNADMFSTFEESELTSMINKIVKETGYDLVILTERSIYNYNNVDLYARDFYVYNGYGIDDEFSGIVLFIDMDPSDRQWTTQGCGNVERLLTWDTINTIDDYIYDYMVDGDYTEAMKVYVSKIEELYTTGDVQAPKVGWGVPIFWGLAIGAIISLVNLSKMKKKMKPVKSASLANDNIVNDSFDMRDKKVSFLYKNVSRVRISSSSGGSGRSSYSSGHSSSGRSFSGGGRHF